jgi:hypothetical protein
MVVGGGRAAQVLLAVRGVSRRQVSSSSSAAGLQQ